MFITFVKNNLKTFNIFFSYFSWNDAYTLELDNFKNFGDPGAEWFGHSIGQKMIKYDYIYIYINLKRNLMCQ